MTLNFAKLDFSKFDQKCPYKFNAIFCDQESIGFILWKVFIKFRWPDEKFIFKGHGSSWIQLHQEKHRTTSKVQIFWEGHKNLAHLPLFILYYLKVRNFQKQIVILPKHKHFLFGFFVKKKFVRSIFWRNVNILLKIPDL